MSPTYESIPPFSRYGQGDAHMSLWQILKDSGYDPDVAPFPGLPSLTKGYNAAGFTGATNEAKITNAIAKAVTDGKTYVYVPASMLPYNASLVTFNTAVKMLREAGRDDVWDVEAYGCATSQSDNSVGTNAACAACVAATGGVVFWPKNGSYTYTGGINVLGPGVTLKGQQQYGTKLVYTGSSNFIQLGTNIHGSNWSGSLYDGIVSGTLIEDLYLQGPGIGVAGAVGITDWGAGSNIFNRLTITKWDKGYFGIQADISTFIDIYTNQNNTSFHLASRSDQNSFFDCNITQHQIGILCEYANGLRVVGGEFVFANMQAGAIADIVFDCPAVPTLQGDIRVGYQAAIMGVWFESQTGGTAMPRHIWVGRGGSAARIAGGIELTSPRIQAANTTHFMDVDAGDSVSIHDPYCVGSITGYLLNVNTIASVTPAIEIDNPRMSPTNNIVNPASTGSLQNVQVILSTRRVASVAYTTPYTPAGTESEMIRLSPLTGNLTVNAPTIHLPGRKMQFTFIQDGTGGRTVSLFFIQNSTYSDAGNVADAICTMVIFWDGFNWSQISCTGWNGVTPSGRVLDRSFALTSGVAPALNASIGDYFTLAILTNIAVVVGIPTNPPVGSVSQDITIAIRNASGGALGTAPTFNTGAGGFKFSAVTNPANGTQVEYKFRWDPVQSFWYEVGTHLAAGI